MIDKTILYIKSTLKQDKHYFDKVKKNRIFLS